MSDTLTVVETISPSVESQTVVANSERSKELAFEMEVSPAPVEVIKVTKKETKEKAKKEKAPKIEKERINGLVPKKLLDKIKNICFWEPDVTMTSLLEQGLEWVLTQYPDREMKGGKLKVGRRPKVNPSQNLVEEVKETPGNVSQSSVTHDPEKTDITKTEVVETVNNV